LLTRHVAQPNRRATKRGRHSVRLENKEA